MCDWVKLTAAGTEVIMESSSQGLISEHCIKALFGEVSALLLKNFPEVKFQQVCGACTCTGFTPNPELDLRSMCTNYMALVKL